MYYAGKQENPTKVSFLHFQELSYITGLPQDLSTF